MGSNLARDLTSQAIGVALYDRTTSGTTMLRDAFVASLERPRRVIITVQAR